VDKEDCFPTWRKGPVGKFFSCVVCIGNKEECSFRAMTWGVEKWPGVRLVKKGKGQPGVERNQKSSEPVTKDVGMPQTEEVVGKQLAKEKPPRCIRQDHWGASILSRAKNVASTVGISGKPPITITSPSVMAVEPTKGTLAIPTTTTTTTTDLSLPPLAQFAETDGHTPTINATPTMIPFTNIVAFTQQASDPTNSLVALEVFRSELRSIILREQNDVEAIKNKMKDRRLIWKGLLARLNNTIVSAGGQVLAEPSNDEEWLGL
jgi:hypothetical protein